MRLKIKIILFSFLLFNFVLIGENFFQFRLANLENKTVLFSDFRSKKATVIIFLLSDCPASQSYTLTLNKLAKKYINSRIAFVGVFPGYYSTDDELQKFKQQYKISFPLLKDPEMILAKKLDAKIGPSCFLFNEKGNVVYKGRIDDWLYAVGKKRQVIKENNLDDALKSLINNKPIIITETNPIGCILEYDKN